MLNRLTYLDQSNGLVQCGSGQKNPVHSHLAPYGTDDSLLRKDACRDHDFSVKRQM